MILLSFVFTFDGVESLESESVPESMVEGERLGEWLLVGSLLVESLLAELSLRTVW
jgi:hypothetical protein